MGRSLFIGVASAQAIALALLAAPAAAQVSPASPAAQPEEPAAAPVTTEAPAAVEDAAASGEDIVVTGFRRSLAEGLALKREAVGVRDSIVAEDIGKFPEANVAESLQRIPGIFLSRDGASNEGQQISIRGLGPSFSVTTINGAPVRTTSTGGVGGSSRTFNFDVFPSELFGRVDIYKSPLANLEEGGISGNVDLQTPRPFDSKGRVVRYSLAQNYNTGSGQIRPRGSLLVSDTIGNFGALFGIAYAENVNERSGFQSTGGYNSTALAAPGFLSPAPPPNTTGTFPFALDLDNPTANFGSLTRAQVANAYMPRFYRVFTSSNERQRLGMVGSLQYKSDRFEASVDGIYSRLTDVNDEFTFGVPVRNGRTVPGSTSLPGRGTNSGLIPVDVKIDQYNNLYGTFDNSSILTESFYRDAKTEFKYGIARAVWNATDTLKFSAQGNLNKSEAFSSGNRVVSNIYSIRTTFDPTVNVTYPTISSPVSFTDPRSFTDPSLGFGSARELDEQRSGRFVVNWDAGEFAGAEWSALLGASYVSSIKEVERRDGTAIGRSRTLPGGGTFATLDVFSYMVPFLPYGAIADGGNAGYPSQFATFPRAFVMDFLDANGANAASPVQLNSKFRAEEIVKAAFFEANMKLPLGQGDLRGNVGMRYADTSTIIDNYAPTGGGAFAPRRRRGGYDNWLPSLSLAWDITPKVLVRGSAGKTITRSALVDIASGIAIPNRFNPDVTVGNPNLRPQTATQYDFSAEWYFQPGAVLSVGAFKKSLKDTPQSVTIFGVPFSSLQLSQDLFDRRSLTGSDNGTIQPDQLFNVTTVENQGKLELKGLEIAYQQNLTFLPAPFDGLGVLGSFTKVWRDGNDFVTTKGTSVSISSVPDYSYSATAFYEKGPFAIRGSWNYRARSGNGSVNNGNDQIAYTAPQGFLDGTVSYRVNERFELRVDALNITNQNLYIYYENPDQPKGNGQSRRDNSFFNGTTISFGIRGKF
ncbi:TonB-dependent receptor [Sphingomonas phyllosphaerae]|uniref:TonB-dependent receptor n=1 Tax=Sphingomonas phyllosphaerae TaxID=257003 RepID=UPI0003FFC7EB|nr:TonB-dependent receptor [Sphingomonas phyllosphaerae]